MIYRKEQIEALAILDDMLVALVTGIPTRGKEGSELRRVVGNLQANAVDLIEDSTIGTELLVCFEQARTAGATLDSMDRVRSKMESEAPIYTFGVAVKLSGMVFSFIEQCQLISAMTFVSRTDVEIMMERMNKVIEIIKLEVAELLDGMNYQYVVQLAATLIQHLAVTERKLPRIVNYTLPTNQPALKIANYLYGDGGRYEELIHENGAVNPVFFQREIRALSE